MSKRNYNLCIIAHPDDETLFMGGFIMSNRERPWHIICVTDGNADGNHEARKRDFGLACEALGADSYEMLDFPDVYEERLDVERLIKKLESLPLPEQVFTHGIIGEYGHPHHQDVSWAVHKAFQEKASVHSFAYNCMPDYQLNLKEEIFSRKTKIISEIYASETQRFSHLIPATSSEGFVQLSWGEVDAIYSFLSRGVSPDADKVKAYSWYWDHFRWRFEGQPDRVF